MENEKPYLTTGDVTLLKHYSGEINKVQTRLNREINRVQTRSDRRFETLQKKVDKNSTARAVFIVVVTIVGFVISNWVIISTLKP